MNRIKHSCIALVGLWVLSIFIVVMTPVTISGQVGSKASKDVSVINTPRVIPIKPMTTDVEVLFGNPEAEGEPFVMRIRELPGTIIPPHKHPVDEHITVVQGTIYFAIAEKFDRSAMKEIKTGGYAFIPKGSTMFGYIPDGAIVQVHGTGPFHIYWRAGASWHQGHKTLDDRDAAAHFKFRKGERVVTRRGPGRIRQAYFSGEILQYEIEGEDGSLFMAEEVELRRR